MQKLKHDTMKILKAGTKVTTVIGNIEAIVVSVCITVDTVEYKIRYFANGEEKIAWLYRFEIEVTPKKQPAGFASKVNTNTFDDKITLIQN